MNWRLLLAALVFLSGCSSHSIEKNLARKNSDQKNSAQKSAVQESAPHLVLDAQGHPVLVAQSEGVRLGGAAKSTEGSRQDGVAVQKSAKHLASQADFQSKDFMPVEQFEAEQNKAQQKAHFFVVPSGEINSGSGEIMAGSGQVILNAGSAADKAQAREPMWSRGTRWQPFTPEDRTLPEVGVQLEKQVQDWVVHLSRFDWNKVYLGGTLNVHQADYVRLGRWWVVPLQMPKKHPSDQFVLYAFATAPKFDQLPQRWIILALDAKAQIMAGQFGAFQEMRPADALFGQGWAGTVVLPKATKRFILMFDAERQPQSFQWMLDAGPLPGTAIKR